MWTWLFLSLVALQVLRGEGVAVGTACIGEVFANCTARGVGMDPICLGPGLVLLPIPKHGVRVLRGKLHNSTYDPDSCRVMSVSHSTSVSLCTRLDTSPSPISHGNIDDGVHDSIECRTVPSSLSELVLAASAVAASVAPKDKSAFVLVEMPQEASMMLAVTCYFYLDQFQE